MVTTEIDPFIEATVDVLAMMTDTQAEAKSITETAKETLQADFTGVMGLAGESGSMALTLSFPSATLVPIAALMMDEPEDEAEASAPSVLGELLNMISGQARATLSAQGFDLDMALPTVVKGNGLSLIPDDAKPLTIVEFESSAGGFYLTLAVDRAKD